MTTNETAGPHVTGGPTDASPENNPDTQGADGSSLATTNGTGVLEPILSGRDTLLLLIGATLVSVTHLIHGWVKLTCSGALSLTGTVHAELLCGLRTLSDQAQPWMSRRHKPRLSLQQILDLSAVGTNPRVVETGLVQTPGWRIFGFDKHRRNWKLEEAATDLGHMGSDGEDALVVHLSEVNAVITVLEDEMKDLVASRVNVNATSFGVAQTEEDRPFGGTNRVVVDGALYGLSTHGGDEDFQPDGMPVCLPQWSNFVWTTVPRWYDELQPGIKLSGGGNAVHWSLGAQGGPTGQLGIETPPRPPLEEFNVAVEETVHAPITLRDRVQVADYLTGDQIGVFDHVSNTALLYHGLEQEVDDLLDEIATCGVFRSPFVDRDALKSKCRFVAYEFARSRRTDRAHGSAYHSTNGNGKLFVVRRNVPCSFTVTPLGGGGPGQGLTSQRQGTMDIVFEARRHLWPWVAGSVFAGIWNGLDTADVGRLRHFMNRRLFYSKKCWLDRFETWIIKVRVATILWRDLQSAATPAEVYSAIVARGRIMDDFDIRALWGDIHGVRATQLGYRASLRQTLYSHLDAWVGQSFALPIYTHSSNVRDTVNEACYRVSGPLVVD